MLHHKGLTAAIMLAVIVACCGSLRAADYPGNIRGTVKDASGAAVTGAFVKVKNEQRRLTFMVVSQAQGRYSANGLPPGNYTVQGIGNGFESPLSAPVEVANQSATVDVSLTTRLGPAYPPGWPGDPGGRQMWRYDQAPLESVPGEGQEILETKCTQCHNLSRVLIYRVDRDGWTASITKMRNYIQGMPNTQDLTEQEVETLLDYMVTNYGPLQAPHPNSRLPRGLMSGDGLRYMVVDFELPVSASMPHDGTVDFDGNGWVGETGTGYLGKMDVNTLEYTRIPVPRVGSVRGNVSNVWTSPEGTIWTVDNTHRLVLEYDPKTGNFNTWKAPPESMRAMGANTMVFHPNGTRWGTAIGSNQVWSLNPQTGEFRSFDVPSAARLGHSADPYGMAISPDGMVWFAQRSADLIGRIDPNTGEIQEFSIPLPDRYIMPRRMGADADGNLWIGLHGVGKLLKVDYQTTNMTVYTPQQENSGAYMVSVDLKNNIPWMTMQHADKIARFDPATETFLELPLPYPESDVRRIQVDPNNSNRIWYAGEWGNRMGYIEMLP